MPNSIQREVPYNVIRYHENNEIPTYEKMYTAKTFPTLPLVQDVDKPHLWYLDGESKHEDRVWEEELPSLPFIQDESNSDLWYLDGETSQEVRSVSLNLFDKSKAVTSYISQIPTGVRVTNRYDNYPVKLSDICKPNTTYYIHCEKEYSHAPYNVVVGRITLYINGTGYFILLPRTDTDGTFTTGDTVEGRLVFYGQKPGDVGVEEDTWVDFNNLYIGTEPYTEYQPYVANAPSPSPDYPSPLINTYKAGTYQVELQGGKYQFTLNEDLRGIEGGQKDRLVIDTSNNTLTRINGVGMDVLDGSDDLSWSSVSISAYETDKRYFYSTHKNTVIKFQSIYMSDKFPNFHNLVQGSNTNGLEVVSHGNTVISNLRFFIKTDRLAAPNQVGFNEWLSNNHVTFLYELATLTTICIPLMTNSPSPEYPLPITNAYKAGEYQHDYNGKSYYYKLDRDLRGVSADVSDRFTLDTFNRTAGLVQNVGEYIFDETHDWDIQNDDFMSVGFIGTVLPVKKGSDLADDKLISTHFVAQDYNVDLPYIISVDGLNSRIYLRMHKSLYEDVDAFKAFILSQNNNGTPIKLWYPLEAPRYMKQFFYELENVGDVESLIVQNTVNDAVDVTIKGKSEQVVSEQGINLYDISKSEAGGIHHQTGLEYNSSSSIRSNFIPILPNIQYTIKRIIDENYSTNGDFGSYWYDENKVFISGNFGYVGWVTMSLSAPQNAKYLRITHHFSDSEVCVVGGKYTSETIPPYEPYIPNSPSPDYPSPINSVGYNAGFDVISMNGYENLLLYNSKTWEEWTRLANCEFAENEAKITFSANNYSGIRQTKTMKPNTKYGFLINCIENTVPPKTQGDTGSWQGITIGSALATSNPQFIPGSAVGNFKTVIISQSSLELKTNINISQARTSSVLTGNYIILKDIRMYELPIDSQIERDFETLSADELVILYPFIDKYSFHQNTTHFPYTLRSSPTNIDNNILLDSNEDICKSSDGKIIRTFNDIHADRDYIEVNHKEKSARLYQLVGSMMLDGSEGISWTVSNPSVETDKILFSTNKYDTLITYRTALISNKFLNHPKLAEQSDTNGREVVSSGDWTTQKLRFLINTNRLTTLDSDGFNEWLSYNPTEIQYKLINPITTEIDYNQIMTYYQYTQLYTTGSDVIPDLEATVRMIGN